MHAVLHALELAGSMAWVILWPLVFGFAISAVIQSVVRKSAITSALGGDGPRTRLSLSRGHCSAAARRSSPRWPSRSPRPTWSSNSE